MVGWDALQSKEPHHAELAVEHDGVPESRRAQVEDVMDARLESILNRRTWVLVSNAGMHKLHDTLFPRQSKISFECSEQRVSAWSADWFACLIACIQVHVVPRSTGALHTCMFTEFRATRLFPKGLSIAFLSFDVFLVHFIVRSNPRRPFRQFSTETYARD